MNVWFASDHHFNHTNILTFTNAAGEKLRPEFSTVEEMNETMIERHNARVKSHEKVYFLGDVGFNTAELELILPRMNGKKRLILGNHDAYKMSWYEKYFHKILVSWNPVRSLIFTHYPIVIEPNHPKLKGNVHGHIHRAWMKDPRYLNISVEMTNYAPIHFDEIVQTYAHKEIEIR